MFILDIVLYHYSIEGLSMQVIILRKSAKGIIYSIFLFYILLSFHLLLYQLV